MLTFIEWCSGLGGMRIAMERLGHTCLGYCEVDPVNIELYPMMHTTEGLWFRNDIQVVDPKEIPEADCYCISCPGFVCQNFLAIVEKRKPKFIIFEGDSVPYCRPSFESLGYYFEMEQSTVGHQWAYAVAQRNTKTKIFPIGINDYMVGDDWEEKEFPLEKLEKIRNTIHFGDANLLPRLTQIKAFVEIAQKIESGE